MAKSGIRHAATPTPNPRFGLARVLSKLGVCSRNQAEKAVRDGRVSVDGRTVRDPERATNPDHQRICLDGNPISAVERVYIVLNKPRGIVVSAADERGRETVYELLADSGLPWLGPVGRLDKASEGLLLLSNDSKWAEMLTDPRYHVDKTYHVQIDAIPDQTQVDRLIQGVSDKGERLAAKRVSLLRVGEKNAWLEITLDEGRNRHIRRLLAAEGIGVLRLIRVALGSLSLGKLAKGQWRHLTAAEVTSLAGHASAAGNLSASEAAQARPAKSIQLQSRHERGRHSTRRR